MMLTYFNILAILGTLATAAPLDTNVNAGLEARQGSAPWAGQAGTGSFGGNGNAYAPPGGQAGSIGWYTPSAPYGNIARDNNIEARDDKIEARDEHQKRQGSAPWGAQAQSWGGNGHAISPPGGAYVAASNGWASSAPYGNIAREAAPDADAEPEQTEELAAREVQEAA